MEQQLTELVATVTAIQKQNSAIQASMGSLEEIKPFVVKLLGWKPAVDQAVADLRTEMGDLRLQVEKLARTPAATVKLADLPPLLPTPSEPRISTPKEEPSALLEGESSHGPNGHRVATTARGKAIGEES
uniref:Uncharacterized protein n=1 Tax=Oryza sativa subsp. japonica TaxID=39947 RepID=Q6YSD0_ORYSJ|nr:hypothetical protein [Oryza sativa Japonica Group]